MTSFSRPTLPLLFILSFIHYLFVGLFILSFGFLLYSKKNYSFLPYYNLSFFLSFFTHFILFFFSSYLFFHFVVSLFLYFILLFSFSPNYFLFLSFFLSFFFSTLLYRIFCLFFPYILLSFVTIFYFGFDPLFSFFPILPLEFCIIILPFLNDHFRTFSLQHFLMLPLEEILSLSDFSCFYILLLFSEYYPLYFVKLRHWIQFLYFSFFETLRSSWYS